MYDGYHFWGMHMVWWIIWVFLLFWIFATPYEIPGARKDKRGALEILEKRFANGDISEEEFMKRKKALQE